MMNNNPMVSLLGAGKTAKPDPSRRFGDKRDITEDQTRQFSKLFEEETDKTDKGNKKEETGKGLIEGKKEEKSEKTSEKKEFVRKEKTKMESKTEELQRQLSQKIQQRFIKTNKTLNFIYNLMYKNPDTLSVSEKQALHIEKQSPDHQVGMKEFKNMLKQKGLKMSDLSLRDFANLMKTKNHSQMRGYLDKLANMKQNGLLDETEETKDVEKGKEKIAEKQAAEKSETPRTAMENLNEALKTSKTEQSKEAEEAARQTRREEVIDQILEKVEVRNIGGRTDLQLKLNPEYLGELKINFTKDENGRMTAKFETTNREVKELLNESIDELKQSLGKQGLKIHSANIKMVDEEEIVEG